MAWDGGAIVSRLHMDVSGWAGAINKAIGSLSGFSAGLLATGAAVGLFTGKYMLDASREAQKFEDQIVELRKVAGQGLGDSLSRGIRDMARELPVARDAMMEVATSAVRLGITGRQDLLDFTRTMSMIGEVTDMTAIQASESFARLAAVMQVPTSEISNLASAANQLSDTMATSFSELVRSAGEMAPILAQMGVAPEQILAVAAAQNEVNVSVQRGAQRLRSFFQQMGEGWRAANIAPQLNMTQEAFEEMVRASPVETFVAIATKMREGSQEARNLREAFDSAAQLGVLGFSQNLERFGKALTVAEVEMRQNNSLVRQFGEFAQSTSAKQQAMNNELLELKTTIGNGILPLRRAWFSFWAGTVSGINDVLNAINPAREALERLPREIATATESMVHHVTAMERYGKAFYELPYEEQMDVVRMTRGELADLADTVSDLAAEMEDSSQAGALLNVWLENALPNIRNGNLTIAEATELMFEWREGIEAAATSFKKLKQETEDELTGGGGDDPVERLRGMNKELAKGVLSTYGFTLNQVTDQQAQFLMSIHETRIALTDGDEAARRFALSLQGYSDSLIDVVLQEERWAEAVEGQRDRNERWNQTISSLKRYADALEQGGEALERLRLEEEDWADWEIDIIRELEKRTQAIEEGNAAEDERIRSYQDLRSAMRDELEQVMMTKEQLFELQMVRLGLSEAEKENLRNTRALIEATRSFNAENERSAESQKAAIQRLEDRKRAFDLSDIETQFRFLERTADNFTSAIVDGFDDMVGGTKKFSEAFGDMLNDIRKELLRFAMNQAIYSILTSLVPGGGASPFKVGSFSPVGGSTSSMLKGRQFNTNNLPMAGNVTQVPEVTVNFNVSSIDARGVSEMLREQGPVIADVATRHIRNNSGLRNRIG